MVGILDGLVLLDLLGVTAIIGFAYIILILARKESGNTKVVGQIIASSLVIMALIVLAWAGIYGNKMKSNIYRMMEMKKRHMIMKTSKMPGMMKHMMKNISKEEKEDMKGYIDKVLDDPELKKSIESYLKTKK